MKHVYILFFTALFALQACSKDKDPNKAILECRYKLIMQKDTVSKSNPVEDEMVLRIGKNSSQFFSWRTFYHDSLWADPQGRKKAEKLSIESFYNFRGQVSFGPRTTKKYLYKNIPKGKMTTYTYDFVGVNFFYEEDFAPQNWVIEDSTKKILKHTCKKATCDYRGRRWIAWFAPDIRIKDGPWKLNGLPGLILRAYDVKKDYYYTATKITKKPTSKVTFYKFKNNQEVQTDRITYNKTLEKYLMGAYAEDVPLIQEIIKKGVRVKYRPRSAKKLRYDFLERDHLEKQ